MELVVVLVAVAVLGLAALVAVGRFGQMQAEPVWDIYQPPVGEGALHAEDLEGVRFAVTPMGYDMAQVDELMARIARELHLRDGREPAATVSSRPPAGAPDDRSASPSGEGTPIRGPRPAPGPDTE